MGWFDIIKAILPTVLGWFGIGAKDERDEERQTGERLGIAETKASNDERALEDVEKAVQAGEAARVAIAADPSRLRDPANPAARPYDGKPD